MHPRTAPPGYAIDYFTGQLAAPYQALYNFAWNISTLELSSLFIAYNITISYNFLTFSQPPHGF